VLRHRRTRVRRNLRQRAKAESSLVRKPSADASAGDCYVLHGDRLIIFPHVAHQRPFDFDGRAAW